MNTRQQVEQKEAEALAAKLREDYLDARVLEDGSVAALHDLIFTRSIMLGCNDMSWTRRFCFEDRALATKRFQELRSEDDEPEGFITRRSK